MELFQELVFTISFSLIVSLLIVKLFSVASSCGDGNSTLSTGLEEKIEKDWVVCDSETAVYFEDPVKVSEEIGFGYVDAELGSGFVINGVGGEGDCYVFDEMPERTEVNDAGDEGNVVESSVSLTQEDSVKSVEVQHGSSMVVVNDCYVSDEIPEVNNSGVDSVENDEGNVVEPSVLLIQEDCVKSIQVQPGSSFTVVGEGVFDDDWQGIEPTELEKSFGAAVAFMDSKNSADRVNLINNQVKIQLYGLHKVAIEGACFEPQPMALKVSARANWNSWKRSENLGREDAMEQYIALLSLHVPDWIGRHDFGKQ